MWDKMDFMNWLINFFIRVYTRITCRIDAPDLQKVPMQGPLIITSNHTGQIEVPLIYAHLQPRKLTGWAKIEAWDNKFLNWVFGVWGMIPVRRGEADMHALKDALRALEKGLIFGITPEGTRNRNGILKRGLPGAVTIALHSGAPILPVAHWGGEKLMRNLKHFKRTDFHIRLGEPYKINTQGIRVTGEIRQQIVDEMMVQIAKLMPEEYHGEYADQSEWTEKYIQKETA
jgi:1-acyl-sn-glycerol-3-phosphate acyltransferase